MTPQLKLMKTEAKKGYDCGFALTEEELRRLHDTLSQQIRRTPAAETFHSQFEVKYRNGSVAYPTSLDDAVDQENFGSNAITRFKLSVSDSEAQPSNFISVEFTNMDEDKGDKSHPITYGVSGDDRDWVFVTGSQLDERISKIKLFSLAQYINGPGRSWSFAIPMFLMLLAIPLYMGFDSHRDASHDMSQIDSIERSWKSGALRDPVQATIDIARITTASHDKSPGFLYFTPVFLLIPLFGVQWLAKVIAYFQPPFNFLWGDTVPSYNKRRNFGKFLLGGVFLVIVLGLLVNYLSKRFGIS